MPFYSGYGLVLDSDIELPELPAAEGPADIEIRRGIVPRFERRASLFEEVRVYKTSAAFHIRSGRSIVFEPLPGSDPAMIRVVLLGTVMAFVMRQRGWLPLHASGVLIDGEAVLFSGPSGSGKSTTAAIFQTCGYEVISDDVCAVKVESGVAIVQPSSQRIRLHDDSRQIFERLGIPGEVHGDKHSYNLAAPLPAKTFAIRDIFVLEYADNPELSLISGLTAVITLSANSMAARRRMTEEALEVHLRDCAAVAERTRVSRLTRPRSMAAVEDIVKLVIGSRPVSTVS